MHKSYRRPKDPDPIIWKDASAVASALSGASTTVTLYSPFKASYGDLSGLCAPEPLLLPAGCLDPSTDSFEDEQLCAQGSRHGKYSSRSLSRELSLDSEQSDVDSDKSELFMRLLAEADRISSSTGCHIKVTKLTMSKTSPMKPLLRHISP